MADSRGKDLTGTVISSELQALLSSLYFNVDASSFSEAKKIVLQTLLTEAVIAANSNNYQAMTPKAFYDSIMTTARKGIGQLSTDANVTAKSGTGLLNAVHQTLMQTQWLKDWFEVNGVPAQIKADSFTAPRAMQWVSTNNVNMNAFQRVSISPVLPANHRYKRVSAQHAAYNVTWGLSDAGFITVGYTGSSILVGLVSLGGINYVMLELSADGREITLYNPTAIPCEISCSLSINAIVEPYT